MLETQVDLVVEGIGNKYYLDGYAKGLQTACDRLADMTMDLFLDGNTDSADKMRTAYHVMRKLQLAARSFYKNEGIGHLQNSATWMQKIINKHVEENDDNAKE